MRDIKAGIYQIQWKKVYLSRDGYLYKDQINSFTETKRMALIIAKILAQYLIDLFIKVVRYRNILF